MKYKEELQKKLNANDNQVNDILSLTFLEEGKHNYLMLPDNLKKLLQEDIPSNRSIDYYEAIFNTTRLMCGAFLECKLATEAYWMPISAINSRVCYILLTKKSKEEQELFIRNLNK